MTISFQPATRQNSRLVIGISGPSGTGKTLSALRLAWGLTGGGKIVFIDTEGGRANQYAPVVGGQANPPEKFKFLHGTLAAPFSPDRYCTAIKAATDEQPDCIIIDSASHAWEGPGGILEMADRERETSKNPNQLSHWAKPKKEWQRVIATIMQVPCHVIVCLRAKEKLKAAGKQLVSDGWHPICGHELPYELTVSFLLTGDGKPTLRNYDYHKLPINMLHLLQEGQQIDENTGRAFAAWATGQNASAGAVYPLAATDDGPSPSSPSTRPSMDPRREVPFNGRMFQLSSPDDMAEYTRQLQNWLCERPDETSTYESIHRHVIERLCNAPEKFKLARANAEVIRDNMSDAEGPTEAECLATG